MACKGLVRRCWLALYFGFSVTFVKRRYAKRSLCHVWSVKRYSGELVLTIPCHFILRFSAICVQWGDFRMPRKSRRWRSRNNRYEDVLFPARYCDFRFFAPRSANHRCSGEILRRTPWQRKNRGNSSLVGKLYFKRSTYSRLFGLHSNIALPKSLLDYASYAWVGCMYHLTWVLYTPLRNI